MECCAEVTVHDQSADHVENFVVDKENKSRHMWVSNINRHVRANELKKYFGIYGKVVTAKILTNGKNFYGYISMETPDQAIQCIKELNNSKFEGIMIQVSRYRPEMKTLSSGKKLNKARPLPPKKEMKSLEIKPEQVKTESFVDGREVKPREHFDKRTDNSKKLISQLERKLKNAHADISKMKRMLDEYARKNSTLERNSRQETDKIRAERRRLNQDKEEFEKTKKAHQKQLSNEKASLEKELDEIKALRVKLQSRFDNFLISTPRPKSRSPAPRNLRDTTESFSAENRRYRDRDSRNSKRPRREIAGKVRISPPSPPILTALDRRASQRYELFAANKPYFSEDRKHNMPEKGFDFRQKSNFDNNMSDNRTSCAPKNPRRPSVLIQPFMSERYGHAAQKAPPIFGPTKVGHSNHYFSDYGKQYNHYGCF